MSKYLFIFLAMFLALACKTTKDQITEVIPNEVQSEDVVEVESTVPDLLAKDFDTVSNCKSDWKNRERSIIYRDTKRIGRLNEATSGQIFIITQVNQKGYVIDAKIDDENTTVSKDLLRNMALDIVNGYKFEADENAPRIDCGTVKFYLTTM